MKYDATAIFGGIGGLELGLSRSGHTTSLFCECDPEAVSVLRRCFPDVPVALDVRDTRDVVDRIGESSNLLTAGFPCTDLSQAGATKGFAGGRSSLIRETLDILRTRPFDNVLIENVPNWRHLHRGAYLREVTDALEALDYRWAYRTIDARAFGLPQRRLRLFLFATRAGDPREVLFHGNEPVADPAMAIDQSAHGFYWTEGNKGLGWGENCVPTLKGGSTVSIPSPPAVLMPNGDVVTPSITDCERLQGLPAGWTDLPERDELVGGGRFLARRRWVLVGNAVNVEVAAWIGERLARPEAVSGVDGIPIEAGMSWPAAAWSDGKRRYGVDLGPRPVVRPTSPLIEFLQPPFAPLSHRAASGFYKRITASSLRFKPGFVEAIAAYVERSSTGARGATGLSTEPLADAA